MGLRIGNIELIAPKGTNVNNTNSGTQGAYTSDVLVGINHVYVLAGNMNSVAQYTKSTDGTIGGGIRTVNWYNQDTTIANICANNSSVPYSYALYIEGGVEYLVGWGIGNIVYRWVINPTNGSISGRQSFSAPFSMSPYSRAGWDGGRYIYFAQNTRNTNPKSASVYRWDLTTPTVGPVFVVRIPNTFSMDSSYTGSGLLVKDNVIYWGSGANQTNGLLAGFDLTTGQPVTSMGTANPIRPADLQTIGVPTINSTGNISLTALHPSTAYYFATGVARIQHIAISAEMTVRGKSYPTGSIRKNDVTFEFTLEHAQSKLVKYRLRMDNTVIKDWTGLTNVPTSFTGIFPNSVFPIGVSNLIIDVEDADGVTFTDYTLITKTNIAPKLTNRSTLRIHRDDFLLKVSAEDTEEDYISFRVFAGGVQVYPASDWTSYEQSPKDIEVTIPNSIFPVGNTTVRLEVMDDWFTPNTAAMNITVAKANYATTLTGAFDRTTFHKETLTYKGTLADLDADDKVSYRILVNGEEVLPWTEHKSVPLDVEHTFEHTYFNLGANTVRVEHTDDYQTPFVGGTNYTVTKNNSNASILNLSQVTIHGEDFIYRATINDANADPVQYRIFLNDVPVYPDSGEFTEPMLPPVAVARAFRNKEFKIGANVIKVEAKDDMQRTVTSATYTLTKSSIAPVVTIPDIKGWVVRATVSDGNGDKVAYRISYGGEQIYPTSGYTELASTPFDIEYAIPADKVVVGASKVLLIELIDEYGVVGGRSTTVVLQNGGLVLSPFSWGYTQFNTNGHYIRYPASERNNLGRTGQMSMEGWFFKTGQGVTNPRAIAVSKGATYIDIGYNGLVHISIQIGGTQYFLATTHAPKMNVWEHFAFTYDGNSLKFYSNGIHSQTWSYNGSVTNTNVIDIGRFFNGNYNFVGGITEVRMWDVARTDEEIKSNLFRKLSGTEEGLVFYPDLGTPYRPTSNTKLDLTGQTSGSIVGSPIYKDEAVPVFTAGDGTVISNIDLGSVVATNSSNPVLVCLRNYSGYCIKNIRITPEQWELDPVTEVVQLSYTEEPFMPETALIIDKLVDHSESVNFWVRVDAAADALGGGLCKLHVKADITFT